MTSTERYLTVAEAAAFLNTSERFVRRLVSERRVAFTTSGGTCGSRSRTWTRSCEPAESSRSRGGECGGRSLVRLKPRTRDDYEGMLRHYIDPHLGAVAVGEIGTATVRQWRIRLLDDGMSGNRAAKVYRLLRAILYTAVDDGMIKRNPCRIKGADKETEHARPVATVAQVYALADAVPRRFRALVLLGAFTSLRWGELVNLRRVNVDPGAGLVEVADTLSERDDGTLDARSTKSNAGRRTVAVPAVILPGLTAHLAEFVAPDLDAPDLDAVVFLGENGGRLRRSNFRRATHWAKTVGMVGLPAEFHFHDLRHTGNQLAAEAGATTKEMMRRMGHSTIRPAMGYQHSTDRRDRKIAAEMSRRAIEAHPRGSETA